MEYYFYYGLIVLFLVGVLLLVLRESLKLEKELQVMQLSGRVACVVARLEYAIKMVQEMQKLDTSELSNQIRDYCMELSELSNEALKLKNTNLYSICTQMIKKGKDCIV